MHLGRVKQLRKPPHFSKKCDTIASCLSQDPKIVSVFFKGINSVELYSAVSTRQILVQQIIQSLFVSAREQ